eukprot:TRINITY_DN6866_c0_g1_i1.p1 TRINITY_DN6866_c0_g1~~TRINITY_DN6866_c0_g1_i1.p1  ORF type:complete len:232 (-),score=50.55 TRINITY_DN6866_c0_g1_i1:64-759(-)
MTAFSTEKIDERIRSNQTTSEGPLWILLLSGSFNPPHICHVQTLEVAREHFESLGNRVIGGYLSPSSDPYVIGKLSHEAMTLKHRIEMCRLAASKTDWIDVCTFGLASGAKSGEKVKHLLQKNHPNVQIEMIEVCGTDHAVKYKQWKRKSMICIGRKGTTEEAKQGILEDLRGVQYPHPFHLIEKELSDISSTAIRKWLAAEQYDELAQSGYLDLDVATYIQQVGKKIYCK